MTAADAATGGASMPYGRWRRWLRAMRAYGGRRRATDTLSGDPGERTYLAYGFVLLTAMYGPILWNALSLAGRPLADGGADEVRGALVALGAVGLGAACVGGVLLARLGVPLWVTDTDATYALGGVWHPRDVLWRRIVVLVLAVAAAAVLAGSALAAGALDAAGLDAGFGHLLAWGACAAGVAQLPLALAVAAQCPRWRATARGAAVVAAALGVLVVVLGAGLVDGAVPALGDLCVDPTGCDPTGGPAPDHPAVPPGVAVGWASVLAVASGGLLLGVLPGSLDVDATAAAWRRTVATGVAVGAGDASGVRTVAGPVRVVGRGQSFPRLLLRRLPLVARDLLGLWRRRWTVAGSVVAGSVGAALVAYSASDGAAPVLAAMVGAVVCYAASATWAGGLRDLAEQPVPGGLLPGPPARAALAHLPVPVLVAAGAGTAGLGMLGLGMVELDTATSAAPVAGGAAAHVALVLAVVLGVRVWVAGATTAPPELFTPMAGPTGDLSLVVVLSWYLRGWLVVAGVAWAAVRGGLPLLVVAAVWSVLLASLGLRRLDRT